MAARKKGSGASRSGRQAAQENDAAIPSSAAGPSGVRLRWLAPAAIALLVLAGFVFQQLRGGTGGAATTPPATRGPVAVAPVAAPTYVGGRACAGCHAGEYRDWQGSHHDLAMQAASEQSVLGDFSGAKYSHDGVTSTFFRRAGRFLVNTAGPDGTLADYEIAYTFGVMPLQQYLVAFPGGRLQALSIAWDTRARAQGGQRWFHLYPGERIAHDDELHWTGAQQNWNSMCADCHSTNLVKNHDATTGAFATAWSEIDVSCEACHGPGSKHVDWARRVGTRAPAAGDADATRGLTVSFRERQAQAWTMDPQRGIARPSRAQPLRAEGEACAPCHSRRTPVAGDYAAGRPFLDHYLPALITPPLYHPDGQQRDEVYTWGSFVQSRMYGQGVTCSDCHEPHGLKLRAPGNGVCAQCHLPARYDAASHHFHVPGTAGAQCIACHMPATTYMVVDPRHDHSLRVPRPDLSVSDGVPNACNQCHGDRTAQWAAEQTQKWYGRRPAGFQRYRFAAPGADALARVAPVLADPGQPEIARATAAAALARLPPAPAGIDAARRALGDGSPLVRQAAVATFELLAPAQRVPLLAPLLDDPVLIVRIEAARVLAAVPPAALTRPQQVAFDRAADEYIAAQRLHAERPEHRTNLGTYFAQRGRGKEAETEFRAALALPPVHVPAWVNFADLRRVQGRDREAETLLRDGLRAAPDSAPLHHALGLALVRLERHEEALPELARAAALAPQEPRFAYVHAVALHERGRGPEALVVLERALARAPDDRELLLAAALYSRDAGDRDAALEYAARLQAAAPDVPAAKELLEALRAGPGPGP